MSNYNIFDQTDKGRTALSAGNLKQPYRRFLALIDGTRSVAELETVARPGELDQTIDYLAAQGYVRKVSESAISEFSGTNLNDPFSQASLTEDMFVELQRRTIAEAREIFGEEAQPLVDRIGICSTPQDLRACLRIAHTLIYGDVDPGKLKQFVKHIGRNLV